MRITAPLYFATYHVRRCYGGPEEGGWWFDAGEVLHYERVRRADRAHLIGAERRYHVRGYHVGKAAVKPDVFARYERAMLEHFACYDDGRDLGSVLSTGRVRCVVVRGLPHGWT